MRMSIACLVVVASFGPGCFFDPDSSDGVILCNADSECAPRRCDRNAHVCTDLADDADITPPRVVGIDISPRDVRDGDTVTVTVTADEAVAGGSLIFAGDAPDLGFVAEVGGVDGDVVTFSAVVGAAADGVFFVDRVSLTDVAGIVGTSVVTDPGFRVDRTAPTVLNLRAAPVGALAADIAGLDGVVVSFTASEPLARAEAQFADRLPGFVDCTAIAGSALGFTCALQVTAAVGDGAANIVVVGEDLAGNVGEPTVTVLNVDTRPPGVLPGSARALLFDNDRDLVGFLVPGGSVQVSFNIDEEPVAEFVRLHLPGGAVVDLDVTVNATADPGVFQVDATTSSIALTNSGLASVQVQLADDLGHTTDVELAFNAPLAAGIPVVAVVPSSCANPAPGRCPDVDGDGAVGIDDDCILQSDERADCDDADRTSFRGGLEVPDDGRDNDCLNGEVILDQSAARTNAVFVECPRDDDDCVDGVGGGDGTAASPYRKLRQAEAEAAAQGAFLVANGRFQAERPPGTFPEVRLRVPVIGGFERRDGVWSRVALTQTGFVGGRYVFDVGGADINFDAPDVVLKPGATAVRFTDAGLLAGSRTRVIDSGGNLNAFNVDDSAVDDLIVVGGSWGNVRSFGGFDSVRVRHADVFFAECAGDFEIVGGQIERLRSFGTTHIFTSVLRGGLFATIEHNAGQLTLVDTVLRGDRLYSPCTDCGEPLAFSLVGTSTLSVGGDVPIELDGSAVDLTPAQWLGCSFLGCVDVEASEVRADNEAIAITGVDPFAHGASAAAVADRNGDCVARGDGSFVVGITGL